MNVIVYVNADFHTLSGEICWPDRDYEYNKAA